MAYVLETFGLSKRYKSHWALKDVNMRVEKGDIYGFVGENGSGKTTIIRLITGLISPTEGHLALFGISDRTNEVLTARKKLGAVVETPSIYLNMSAADNLKMQCGVIGLKENTDEKIQTVLSEVGLIDLYADKKRAGDYSLGMRQRLGLAMALLGEPEFIVLDEPMNGLDPAGIVEIRELILKLNRERGITFLISSHILTELALVATKYGIISKGKLLKEITAEELRRECRAAVYLETENVDGLCALLSTRYEGVELAVMPRGVKVFGEIPLNSLFQTLAEGGITIDRINCVETGIEDYYLSLIGGAQDA
ncbi:MAG: ATP-binding cassette domain-containing protein [Clostridia bacterium]|nr:ATP-binding cassette domain-containing protein [Clostridia bacterium]